MGTSYGFGTMMGFGTPQLVEASENKQTKKWLGQITKVLETIKISGQAD